MQHHVPLVVVQLTEEVHLLLRRQHLLPGPTRLRPVRHRRALPQARPRVPRLPPGPKAEACDADGLVELRQHVPRGPLLRAAAREQGVEGAVEGRAGDVHAGVGVVVLDDRVEVRERPRRVPLLRHAQHGHGPQSSTTAATVQERTPFPCPSNRKRPEIDGTKG